MAKLKTIDSFFKRKDTPAASNFNASNPEERPFKSLRIEESSLKSPRVEEPCPNSPTIESKEVNTYVQPDPGLRRLMWEFSLNEHDAIRRSYLKMGPYQIYLSNYPFSGFEKHHRRFKASWFKLFPSWFEYSPSKDVAYCLPCYLFNMNPIAHVGSDVFTVIGFKNWKKVNDSKRCVFLSHIRDGPCSQHNNAVRCYEDLKRQAGHIDKVMVKQSYEQIVNNHFQVKTSIEIVRRLTFQACTFIGHDKTPNSINRGNFLKMINLLATFNVKVPDLVLGNTSRNVKYTSPIIQKEILHVLAMKVQNQIREDIGDSKYCIIIDEARDESKREQMGVLKFLDKNGFIREQFFDIIHVEDTTTLTLKKEISNFLARYSLDIQNIRGQGYDGASNMGG